MAPPSTKQTSVRPGSRSPGSTPHVGPRANYLSSPCILFLLINSNQNKPTPIGHSLATPPSFLKPRVNSGRKGMGDSRSAALGRRSRIAASHGATARRPLIEYPRPPGLFLLKVAPERVDGETINVL